MSTSHCFYHNFLFTLLLLTLLITTTTVAVAIGSNNHNNPLIQDQQQRQWCIEMRHKYNILPGKSFGNLPFHQHEAYLRAKCFRFFCKPHPLAGKGVFDCEPIDEFIQQSNHSTVS